LRVLVIGSGGREHAIAWRLASSPSVSEVFVAPGNPGCRALAQCVAPESPTPADYRSLAERLGADLTVVGPEAPLVDGVVDAFNQVSLPIFGPGAAAAQLEGSKSFAKDFMMRHCIPTAQYVTTDSLAEAVAALDRFNFPVVLKADGLAAGKGVVISESRPHAESVLLNMFSGALVGAAGRRVVLEEFLTGEEASFIALSDGASILPFEPSQDHKRLLDNDEGPNTGGMGAYSDSLILNDQHRQEIMDRVMRPTIDGMAREGSPFRGFLYAGIMLTSAGPKVLEFNVRLGDPETQCLLHRLRGDFGAVLSKAVAGRLHEASLEASPDPSVVLVLAAHGYPGKVRSGDAIHGLEEAEAAGATVFHAGTKEVDGRVVTAGGRVLGVTASGSDLKDALAGAYAAAAHIHFDGMQYRKDIGRRGLARYT
jgi:phosphoribosylamine--glycine ligase